MEENTDFVLTENGKDSTKPTAYLSLDQKIDTVTIDPREPFHDDLMDRFYYIGKCLNLKSGLIHADVHIHRLLDLHRANWDKIREDSKDEYGFDTLFPFQRTFMELLYQKPYHKIVRGIDKPHIAYAKIMKEDISYFCWMVEEQLDDEEKKLNDSECICTPTTTCRKHLKQEAFEAQLRFDLDDLHKEKKVLRQEIESIEGRILDIYRTLEIHNVRS